MSKLAEKIKEEIAAIIPPTVFFFIALHRCLHSCPDAQANRNYPRHDRVGNLGGLDSGQGNSHCGLTTIH